MSDVKVGSADRVKSALAAKGLSPEMRTYPASTRTAAEAAAAIGCTVAQIAKSLIFRGLPADGPSEPGRAVLVIASGPNRVAEAKVEVALAGAGSPVTLVRADAAFVRVSTGFAIGGVAPVGHLTEPLVVIDRDLARHAEIWAAAGTPNAVFALTYDQLVELTGGVEAVIT